MGCIELVGCTGAGKTTLVKNILRSYHSDADEVILGEDFVLRQVGLAWIKKEMIRRVIINIVSLVFAIRAWSRRKDFYHFALRVLFDLPIAWSEKLYIGRNVFKNIGIYEISCRASGDQVVLLDEGPLQIAHYLFVHLSCEPQLNQLLAFVEKIPLPDVVAYLRADETILVERILARGHKRIPGGSRSLAECFIHRAVSIFEQLVSYPIIRPHLLFVDFTGAISGPVDQISSFLETALKVLQVGIDQTGIQTGLHLEVNSPDLSAAI